jgi:hypothetical protein
VARSRTLHHVFPHVIGQRFATLNRVVNGAHFHMPTFTFLEPLGGRRHRWGAAGLSARSLFQSPGAPAGTLSSTPHYIRAFSEMISSRKGSLSSLGIETQSGNQRSANYSRFERC